MARSTIKFLKQQGQFNTRIAALAGCDRHTVARVLSEPTDPARQRQRASALEPRRAAVVSWIEADIPATRMLELARQDPAAPYTGGASTFYRFVARLRADRAANAAPVIRFEGLPGEYVQWDWGEARVRFAENVCSRIRDVKSTRALRETDSPIGSCRPSANPAPVRAGHVRVATRRSPADAESRSPG